jgi:hypothetical protein
MFNSNSLSLFVATVAAMLVGVVFSAETSAQVAANTPVQLPTIGFFGVNTVVSVPDGGTMSLGGVSSYSSGQNSNSSFGPFRPFANRSSGYEARATNAAVTPTIIIMSEIEEDVIAQGMFMREVKSQADINGPPEVRAKAAFITRNIGRSTRKR